MQVQVYALLEPVTRKPRYVGQSRVLGKRLKQHWQHRFQGVIREKNPRFAAWISSLEDPPEYFVFESVPYELRHKAEHYYTDLLKQAGCDLLNVNSGAHLSPEHRTRLTAGQKAAWTGRKHAPETLAKFRQRRPSPETRAAMSAAQKGRVVSPETRAKMSASQKARLACKRAEGGASAA